MMKFKLMIRILVPCVLQVAAHAEELRYRPINPAFGGSPLNGSYLMQNGTVQRQHQAPRNRRDPIEEFSESIQSSIVSRVSREISEAILGENAADSGNFTVGDTAIDYYRKGENVVIELSNPSKGGKTTIEVPAPVY